MLNTVYRLVEPRRFEAEFCDINVDGDNILVRPTHLSICNADQRYFQGTRSAEVLKEKLPMALIHEAVGEVVHDPVKDYKAGTKVVLIPNTPMENDEVIAENYLRSSKFRASGYDGFMQDLVSMRRDRIIAIPEDLNEEIAAFTELVSVAYHAIDRFINKSHSRRGCIGVWGDGNIAYITTLLIRKMLPDSKVVVFGKHEYKLNDFAFADETFNINSIPKDITIDHGFECVGGVGVSAAINQIIDYINPEGYIATMGVSENEVSINTRMILEKGLTLFGTSRSGASDFEAVINIYEEHQDVVEYLSRIVSEVIEVYSMRDMVMAFDNDIKKRGGKTIMKWMK